MIDKKLDNRLVVSFSPHIESHNSISAMMLTFVIALLPSVMMGVYYFGYKVLMILGLSIASSMAAEAFVNKLSDRPSTIGDFSAILNGLLLGLLMPPTMPWWAMVVGSSLSIIVGKSVFGGYGNYPLNPVLIGWMIIRLAWPDLMNGFIEPAPLFSGGDISEALPPLMAVKGDPSEIGSYDMWRLMLGNVPGQIGTISALSAILGGLFLLYRGVIRWHIPVGVFLGAFAFAWIFNTINPDTYFPGSFHLMTGTLLLGAFFLAPEPVSSPVTPGGMLVYGLLIGVLTVIIRIWGSDTDGVIQAILIMNIGTPLFDRIRPRSWGVNTGA
ncbi:MAG: RnfABCDGE type electron transport complex subunit D [Deltaproteobacteria bacterium]|nr:RnfABCDGE type electron transport complex subunit D [Deltaproteobacteria bacterium]